jgi:hypothetical protein
MLPDDPPRPEGTSTMRLPITLNRRAAAPALLAFSMLVGGASAGCAADDDHDGWVQPGAATDGATSAAMPAPPSGAVTIPTQAEVAAAWQRRPDYVRALPEDWQAAYLFALERPDVIGWMPCNCGCGGMGHRSNLDCFFIRRESGEIAFEEHGSYCDICVETSNLAARLLREGRNLGEIRAAVDETFGGGGHGTDTPLPPA